MTTYEILSTIVAGVAIVVSIYAAVRANAASAQARAASERANEIAADNLKLMHAQVEIDISNQITGAEHRLQDFLAANQHTLTKDRSKLSADEKVRVKALETLFGSITEGYLNAYDEACQKYIDGKVDKVRFKDKYQRHVRQIAEDKDYDDFLRRGHRYAALMTVYDKWENPERKKIGH